MEHFWGSFWSTLDVAHYNVHCDHVESDCIIFVCLFVLAKATSEAHLESSDGHEEPWEGQTVELHQGAIKAAAAEEGHQPRGPGPGGLHVLH